MIRRWLLIGVALVVVLGCRGGNAQPEALLALLDQCKADAAKRAEVAPADVAVVKAESVVWSDGSLGCPQPGMDYIMMLIPGYRLVLTAGGVEHEYHTDKARRFVYCEGGGRAPAQVLGPVELPGTEPPPETPQAGVLYLRPVADEPNGNAALVRLGAEGAEPTTVLERCTAFAVSPRGDVLARERTSRSTHDLLLAPAAGEARVIATAFDFAALTFSQTDSRQALLVRAAAGQPWVVHVGAPEDDAPKPLDWAPPIQRGDLARISLAGDRLLLTVADSDDDPPRNLVLDLAAQRVLADFRAFAAQLVPGP